LNFENDLGLIEWHFLIDSGNRCTSFHESSPDEIVELHSITFSGFWRIRVFLDSLPSHWFVLALLSWRMELTIAVLGRFFAGGTGSIIKIYHSTAQSAALGRHLPQYSPHSFPSGSCRPGWHLAAIFIALGPSLVSLASNFWAICCWLACDGCHFFQTFWGES
jgi:hypothetical protein